jgi:Uma2 family endonuclease
MAQIATEWPRRHRLTVEDYYRMGEAGILRPDERVELIEGEIIDMAPPGSRHAGTVTQLQELLHAAVGRAAQIRTQNPVSIDRYSEPQPDLAVLRPRADYYKSAHPRPENVLLLIEVADTSLRYDRDIKTSLYARHGIPEVWLVDVQRRQVTRYRHAVNGAYAVIDQPESGAPLEVGALAGIRVELGALFDD